MAPVFTCEPTTVEVSLSRRPRINDYRITSSHTLINQPTWRQLIQRKCDSCSPVETIQEEEGPLKPTSKCLWGSGSGAKQLHMYDLTRLFFHFASNKCARRFEVVAAARHLTETSADCSDKDELHRGPRNTEGDHRDSVGELHKGQPDTLMIIILIVISRRAGSCFSLCGCLQRASVSLSRHCFSPLEPRSFLSVQGDSHMSLFEGNCFKRLGQEKKMSNDSS